MALSPQNRLRPLELFFAFLGMTTLAGLAIFWFRLVPDMMAHAGVEELSGWAAVVTHPAFQIPVLLACMGLLAAGVASRVSAASKKAMWMLAGGCLLAFGALWLSVNRLYQPVMASVFEEAAPESD